MRRGKALAAICVAATVKDAEGNVVEMPKPVEPEEAPVDDASEAAPAQIVTEVDGEEIAVDTEAK